MKTRTLWVVGCLVTVSAFAQSTGGMFEIAKHTIDSGGGISSGGHFTVHGTIAQSDANQEAATGGEFSLVGGFWASTEFIGVIFKNSFENN